MPRELLQETPIDNKLTFTGIASGQRALHEPDVRRHLLAIAPARPQHGGAGALYVLLRKLT